LSDEAAPTPSQAARSLRAPLALALWLTGAVMAVYFGFILLVAFNPQLLATLVAPGLSLGILAGALVIVFSWISTLIYVRWANRHYDDALERLKG
jgi:uncharacterized membrane protein (DUF485 family)